MKADNRIAPFSVKIEDNKDAFSVDVRAFKVGNAGKISFENVSRSLKKDQLNPPLYWDKKNATLSRESVIIWGHLWSGKHIICVAVVDGEGYLTVSYYDEVAPQQFQLTLLKDPYLGLEKNPETNINAHLGDYVGRGDVTHVGSDGPVNTKRDIDFTLKKYNRGFELVKSLIICPEGREYCKDGKRKNNKYYFRKERKGFFSEEAKGSLFTKSKPFTLKETGHVQYAVWHKGHLKTYIFNYSPQHPLILEYGSWRFAENGGQYYYQKYIDAKLNKTVKGQFFRAKDDDQYKPKTPS